jgi:hypothetical protein
VLPLNSSVEYAFIIDAPLLSSKFFSLLFFFWVVGCKKALKKSKIGLGLSHYFYYHPVG